MAGFVLLRKQRERYDLKKSKIDGVIAFDEDLPKKCKLTFVDFAATQKYQNEGIKSAKYSQILEFANQWLKNNDFWEVIGCETIPALIQFDINESSQIINKQILITYSITENVAIETHVRHKTIGTIYQVLLLRFYIKRVDNEFKDTKNGRIIQQIRFTDFKPNLINDKNEFENIDQLVEKINENIRSEQINGKIFNVQTLSCRTQQDWTFDSESTEPISTVGKCVNILRIFYELGPHQEEEIGLADFIPECISGGSLLKKPQFETQTVLLERASKWLSENPEVNFCGALTVDVKLKSMVSINTKQMSYTRDTGDYMRVLRIAYTKPAELPPDIPLSSTLPPPPPIYLMCETFPLYNSYSELKRTLSEFYSRDEWTAEDRFKWHFLNCETLFIYSINKRGIDANLNQSFQVVSLSKSAMNTGIYYAIKVYYDVGFYGIEHNEQIKGNTTEQHEENQQNKNSCVLS